MEKCPSLGFEPSMYELQFDMYLARKVVKANDFMPDLKVERFMPVCRRSFNSSVLMTKNEITR